MTLSLSSTMYASLPIASAEKQALHEQGKNNLALLYAKVCRLKIEIDSLEPAALTSDSNKRNLYERQAYFSTLNVDTCSFLDLVRYSSCMLQDYQSLEQARSNFNRRDLTDEQNAILLRLENPDAISPIVQRLLTEALRSPRWQHLS